MQISSNKQWSVPAGLENAMAVKVATATPEACQEVSLFDLNCGRQFRINEAGRGDWKAHDHDAGAFDCVSII